jgi:site-specific DNA-methyltransferase (adenine-specific)
MSTEVAEAVALPHPSELLDRAKLEGLRDVHTSDYGVLFQGDCLRLLESVPDEAVDLIFADPPFNLGKDYGPGITDQMKVDEYLRWSREWLAECVRVLAPGGTLMVFNLPRWLIDYGAFLSSHGMQFRHWIAMRMPKAYPRGQRMSPAHYGCIYYTKGEPKAFNRIYVPIETCRHCGGEIRDYGGHRKALNERGINLMDVFNAPEDVWDDASEPMPPGEGWTDVEDIWADVPPVRHNRYKLRGANALAPIMLERLVAMASDPGHLVLDPFGGTATTYYAAEKLQRRWLGVELGDTNPAVRRMMDLASGKHECWETARGKPTRTPADHAARSSPMKRIGAV